MFKIESYVTPILLSYVDKYVRDFKPADAQVSLWGGGVALHNLVLKADVLQQEVALPFTLVSGRIHELLIQVPWTKIMSEPIVITIDTIECVLNLNPPEPQDDNSPPEPPRRTQVVEAPPGYMQALVRRIVSNIALRVHHLIVKYVQDDIVLSLNVKHLAVDSAGPSWELAFADIDPVEPVIRRLVRLDDLTLCLDRADSDGKIRFYQEPLLYRCQLDLRVLTRLVSANTRRAIGLSVQLRSSKLAWGVTNDQLVLLLRLLNEIPRAEIKLPPPAPKMTAQSLPLHTSQNSAEPARVESWSEWAWSWLPTLADREGAEETPTPPTPIPIALVAYLDDVSLVLKIMEVESSARKRARAVLEVSASHAAIKSKMRAPTMMRVHIGLRNITLNARGKCPCGHTGINAYKEESTVYLSKIEADLPDKPWTWPEEDPTDARIELAQVADEPLRGTVHASQENRASTEQDIEDRIEEPTVSTENMDPLWQHMQPILFVEYSHERSPPQPYTNPYENPPSDFQYSDWVEVCAMRVQVHPLGLVVSPALVHRLSALYAALGDLPPTPVADLPTRTLTVEECEALMENLPQKRISIDMREMRVRIVPWDHASVDKTMVPLLSLDIEVPKAVFVITGPLYPHRVCSASCQMPEDSGPLWNASRLHVSGTVSSAQAQLWTGEGNPRPCARADIRFALHMLLNKHMFSRRESVLLSYILKLREVNVCGSSARLQAASQVISSLMNERLSPLLHHSTLAKDALNDEESVAIDLTAEELSLRGYLTANVNTHILSLQSARATAHHAPKDEEVKQAWLFSAPDVTTTTPYLRFAVQWCKLPPSSCLEYLGLWTEPISFCVDPLFIAWLAYKPTVIPYRESHTQLNTSASQYGLRRRPTPPSSSGRAGSRAGSGAELVHVRPRSIGSSSEPSEQKQPPAAAKPEPKYWDGERVVNIHTRLRRSLVNIELGMVQVYATSGTASALDCATVHDAMERHARYNEPVLALSLGRVSMHSNSTKKHLWQEIRHDGPTFINTSTTTDNTEEDSFPWKLRLADMSCYILGLRAVTEQSSREFSRQRSQLKVPDTTVKTVVEMVTTTVTLSVVTKSLQIKANVKKEKTGKMDADTDDKTKYFTAGTDFKPSTLKEFFRGPAKRRKSSTTNVAETPDKESNMHGPVLRSGPLVSLGVHLHADTPPIIVRLDHEQVHLVATAVHGVQHILVLLQRRPVVPTRIPSYTSIGTSRRSLIRSVSEIEELRTPSEETQSENQSENRSELIPIFEAHSASKQTVKLKMFFWFQWVVSRATLVVATRTVKLAFDMDDIISTVDLQSHYSQLKVKVASASVRHYERTGSYDWTAGVLGGRVLEAREPTNAIEENHFMSITVTQARISNLPANWKEELNPKLLEEKNTDTMWEIYATVAPLEAVLQPEVLKNIVSLAHEFSPRSFCPLQSEVTETRITNWQWPMCYVNAGGLRLLLTSEENGCINDDTFIFQINKLTVNPYPENPICRRPVNTAADVNWLGSTGLLEGQQYEVLVHGCGIRSAQLHQLACQEVSENELLKGTGGENPALKWTQPVISPIITPMLHNVDISCVLAPAIYSSDVLVSGPAVELNLVSDCALDVSIEQLRLASVVLKDLVDARPNELLFEKNECDACPFAPLLMRTADIRPNTNENIFTEDLMKSSQIGVQSVDAADSGVDTVTSHSTLKTGSRLDDATAKKTLSVVFVDHTAAPSEYLEVFVTMGVIDISLYAIDDGSPLLASLRPPAVTAAAPAPATSPVPNSNTHVKIIFEENDQKEDEVSSVGSRTKSLSDTLRAGGNTSNMRLRFGEHTNLQKLKKVEGSVPLIHITLHQPNLYYWRRKCQKSFQVSLFNAWVGLGWGQMEGQWNVPLLSTGRGAADPVTDIPPALATLRLSEPASGNSRNTIRLDVERPVQLEVSTDRVRRIKAIMALIHDELPQNDRPSTTIMEQHLPLLYKIRRLLVYNSVESLTVHTNQLSVCGGEGTFGCDGISLQTAVAARPDRLNVRALIHALLVAAGPPGDRRHPIVLPTALGVNIEATWETWRRTEGGSSSLEPTVHLCVDVDQLSVDLRPTELAALTRLNEAIAEMMSDDKLPLSRMSEDNTINELRNKPSSLSTKSSWRRSSYNETEISDHYYKDDLRSGAFKMVGGGQLPMAYQVTLHTQTVAWRYPHPRAITRVLAFPLPDQDEELECILEFYNPVVGVWHSYTYFIVPVSGPNEVKLYVTASDAVFAQMWRMRPKVEKEPKRSPFEFDFARYLPRSDPMIFDHPPETEISASPKAISAEQLCGAVRVDSYFAPRALPRLRLCVRTAGLQLHAYNSLPSLSTQSKSLEGYYVSRPLMRSHKVLSVVVRDAGVHAHVAAPAGGKLTIDASIAADIMDCATGTMEPLMDEFRLQLAISYPEKDLQRARLRGCATDMKTALHVPRLRTIHSLAADWQTAIDEYKERRKKSEEVNPFDHVPARREVAALTSSALEGRVSMWIHNSCACALRIGQDGTDERVPLGPGARLAYRWRSPSAPKGLRIAFAGPVTDWIWSSSVPFMAGTYRIRLENGEALGGKGGETCGGVYAYVKVEGAGARRYMRLAGRLELANMLRYNLLFKVRTRCHEAAQWQTVMSGELEAESVGRSVMCAADAEMALKIKFTTHDTGWSGDIPLKECPKENVPWLVKVPSEGDLPYNSVWCRVVRARSDGRILAAIWPLYVLYSHVPHDTDVMIETEATMPDGENSVPECSPPLIQTAPGRGTSTHLVAPGTTAARHNLSFQYRNIDCPVTRDAVPLHYGVTDTSVFDKRAPVHNLEDVVQDILTWLERSGRHAKSSWPYSLVAKHWPGSWQPALLQPRCDVNVRYEAVRAGGGCSLELRLSPTALLCNAAPVALTLRAHDATPLCKLESGTAICPPSLVLQKPFFISMELVRDTFVSGQLVLSNVEPGRYGTPPPGHLAPNHPMFFAIHCNNKVALLTMYYEIIHEINVLGISSTYEFINMLDDDVVISAVAVPKDLDGNLPLQPKMFKVIEPSTEKRFLTKSGTSLLVTGLYIIVLFPTYLNKDPVLCVNGVPLCRFWLGARWRSGGDPSELAPYLCLALSVTPGHDMSAAVPVRLGQPPLRRALALIDANNQSIPVVVTQLKHEGRWLVTVSRDPCPQFLVHNHTSEPLVLAQPVLEGEEPSSTKFPLSECEGIRWWLVVGAGAVMHYSSPAHNERYPPPSPQPPQVQFLTFARARDVSTTPDFYWCAPVAVTEGEQLVQLYGGRTVKLRVHTHTHSTLLHLRDVDETDISASDIRNRLLKPHLAKESTKNTSIQLLERERANSRLLFKTITMESVEPFKAETELLHTGGNRSTSDANIPIVIESESTENIQSKYQQKPKQSPDDIKSETANTITVAEEESGSLDRQTKTTDIRSETPDKSDTEQVTDDNLTIIKDPSLSCFRSSVKIDDNLHVNESQINIHKDNLEIDASHVLQDGTSSSSGAWSSCERMRFVVSSLVLELAGGADEPPLLALHLDRVALLIHQDDKGTNTTLSIAGVQIDNLQYSSGQYDFAVVASTANERTCDDRWPFLWGMLIDIDAFRMRHENARVLLKLRRDNWSIPSGTFSEITEVELSMGPLALYVEDAYVSALVELIRLALPAASHDEQAALFNEIRTLQSPLRLRALLIHPLDLTLTLHTAVRMYIALDQSPLQLGAFQLKDAVTSVEQLTHALTVHYLSAAILGAGWVVGGLELLGAPGALAARVGGAGGGVRGVAVAAAAALVRSLAACAGSLARNLDLLAGDEEHARRAAAARRRHPQSLAAGILAGVTNFAINILGAVGGLAHHPLVGVAVGEGSSAAALRRSLVGAVAKPLSATADLVAYAGHGLLTQAGWEALPQPRSSWWSERSCKCSVSCAAGWRRDCVRWTFRLAELTALAGYEVTLNRVQLALLITHKFLVVADLETERIVEMIDFRNCTLAPYKGPIVELFVTQRRVSKIALSRAMDEDEEYQVSAAAMARVARYTGAEGSSMGASTASAGTEQRTLELQAEPGRALALHATLSSAIRNNCDTHFPLL